MGQIGWAVVVSCTFLASLVNLALASASSNRSGCHLRYEMCLQEWVCQYERGRRIKK